MVVRGRAAVVQGNDNEEANETLRRQIRGRRRTMPAKDGRPTLATQSRARVGKQWEIVTNVSPVSMCKVGSNVMYNVQ
jgi:hypothetical protein